MPMRICVAASVLRIVNKYCTLAVMQMGTWTLNFVVACNAALWWHTISEIACSHLTKVVCLFRPHTTEFIAGVVTHVLNPSPGLHISSVK